MHVRLVHLRSARAKYAVIMRIPSDMLPRHTVYFLTAPTRLLLVASTRPRCAVLARVKTRNQLSVYGPGVLQDAGSFIAPP